MTTNSTIRTTMSKLNTVEIEAIIKHGVKFTPEELHQFMWKIMDVGMPYLKIEDFKSFLFQNGCVLVSSKEFSPEPLKVTTVHKFQLPGTVYEFGIFCTQSGICDLLLLQGKHDDHPSKGQPV